MFLYAEQRGRRSINGTQMGPSSSVFVTSRCSVNPYRRWDGVRGTINWKRQSSRLQHINPERVDAGDETSGNGIIAGERGREREREGAIKLQGKSWVERREVQREESAHRERKRERARGIWPTDRWVSAVCGVLPLYLVIEHHIKMVP